MTTSLPLADVSHSATRSGRCVCGASRDRTKTWRAEVDPLSLDPATGQFRTRANATAALLAEEKAWTPDFTCKNHAWVPVAVSSTRRGNRYADVFTPGRPSPREAAMRAARRDAIGGVAVVALLDGDRLLRLLDADGGEVPWGRSYMARLADGCGWTLAGGT